MVGHDFRTNEPTSRQYQSNAAVVLQAAHRAKKLAVILEEEMLRKSGINI